MKPHKHASHRIAGLPSAWSEALAKSIDNAEKEMRGADNGAIETYIRELVLAGVDPVNLELVIREERSADAITHVYSVRPRSSEPVVLSPEDR